MPPKRNRRHSKAKNKGKQPVVDVFADCIFPHDIMVSILKLLPVKSIVRFKCVCKPWLKLFSTHKFIKMHYDELLRDPANEALIIYSLSAYHDHTMSLVSLASDEDKPKPVNLVHPYPEVLFRMDFVGCCNGLVCMGCPPLGQGIVLWNPALRLYKFVRLSDTDFGAHGMVSLGFGYDAVGDDFKVVRVVCLEDKKGKRMRVGVEVYSGNSDSWKTVKVGFKFRVLWTKNDVIVNGNPYWVARVDENEGIKRDLGEVLDLVCFDVVKMAFKIVPLSTLNLAVGSQVPLVEWKGSLGALVCPKEQRTKIVDVYLFNDAKQMWKLSYGYGVLEANLKRLMQWTKTENVVGECTDGKLFAYDVNTGRMKMIVIDEAQPGSFEIHGYTESLACIKGMEKVVVNKGEDEIKKDDDEDDDEDEWNFEDEDYPGQAADIASVLMSFLRVEGEGVVGNFPFPI